MHVFDREEMAGVNFQRKKLNLPLSSPSGWLLPKDARGFKPLYFEVSSMIKQLQTRVVPPGLGPFSGRRIFFK